jgi:tripartite-type tricarboxylate transporter receptor subunit TctC
VHVPYRGQAAALTDLLGGQVLVDFATMPPSIGFPSRSTEKVSCIFGPRRWISAAGDVDYETSYSLKCRPTQRMF